MYDPIKKELQNQGLLLGDEALPRLYSVIKEEVLKQEAIMSQNIQIKTEEPSIVPQEPATDVCVGPRVSEVSIPLPLTSTPTPMWFTQPVMPNMQPGISYIPYFCGTGQPPYLPFPAPTCTPPTINCNIGIPSSVNLSSCQLPNNTSVSFVDQSDSNFGKVKRARTDFTQLHLDILEAAFTKSHYTRGTERDDLARDLKITPKSVTIWFQNRRARMRAEQRQDVFIKKAAETGESDIEKLPDFR